MNIEKIIRLDGGLIKTGYLDDESEYFITHSFNDESEYFIYHSFDDEPARIFTISGTKMWYEDNKIHRDNNLPAIIRSNGYNSYYKNDKHYWFINNKEYYDCKEVKEKFKNKILKLKNINMKILKDNGIDAINLYCFGYLILDQSQYNLAILKFL